MSEDTEQLVEVAVVLRLTPEAHAALVKEANDAGLTIDEKASVILEVKLVDRDPIEEFAAALRRSGTSGPEFADAWQKGQEALGRDSVPPAGDKDSA